jgi:S-phase kinase-associated protein 1
MSDHVLLTVNEIEDNGNTEKKFVPFVMKVDKKIALKSKTLRRFITNFSEESEEGEVLEIPIHKITKKIINQIIEYYTYYKDEIEPIEDDDLGPDKKKEDSKKPKYIFLEWDRNFIGSIKTNDLYYLLLGLDYLSFEKLFELAAWQTAEEIKGRSPQEIKDAFGIYETFDTEDEKTKK